MPHVGTADVDLSLDAEALGDGEYAQLVEALQRHSYRQRGSLRRFQLVRTVNARDGGPAIDVSPSKAAGCIRLGQGLAGSTRLLVSAQA